MSMVASAKWWVGLRSRRRSDARDGVASLAMTGSSSWRAQQSHLLLLHAIRKIMGAAFHIHLFHQAMDVGLKARALRIELA